MRSEPQTLGMVAVYVLLIGMSLLLWGCGAEPSPTTSEAVPASAPQSAPSSTSAAESATPSFYEAWAASMGALDALGPTRVSIVETTEGRLTREGIPPEQSDPGPQIQRAEQLIDGGGGRARLTVNASDGQVRTTVVQGGERTSTIRHDPTDARYVSVDRHISLQAPESLPLPLWAATPLVRPRATATSSRAT